MPSVKISLWNIIDLVLIIAFIVIFFLVMIRRKNLKICIIYFVVMGLFSAVSVLDLFHNLPIAKSVMNLVIIFILMLFLVVYSSEFKTMLVNLGRHYEKKHSQMENFSDEDLRVATDEIIKACQNLSKQRTGALILIAPNLPPNHILETGIKLDALVSSQILESIFNTDGPIHDGAIVIKGNKILSAGCFLPISQSQDIAKSLGTRHRAAIGISEESDMISIVVSEETGIISYAKSGVLKRFITTDRLKDILFDVYGINTQYKLRGRNIQ